MGSRSRRTSLFALENPVLDHGIAVVCHADHPKNEHFGHTKLMNIQEDDLQDESLFNDDIVRHLMREVFEYRLNGIEYRKKEGEELCKHIITDIQKKIAVLDYKRYKIICTCVLSAIDKPPLWLESRSTWNGELTSADKDRFVELVFKNKEFYAIATVFGMYNDKDFRRRTQRETLFCKNY